MLTLTACLKRPFNLSVLEILVMRICSVKKTRKSSQMNFKGISEVVWYKAPVRPEGIRAAFAWHS